MLEDLLDQELRAGYNIKLANYIGLEQSIYCDHLITIQRKARNKNKLEDGYARIDREFIKRRTTLSPTMQIKFDDELLKLGLIKRSDMDKNLIFVDFEAVGALISNDNDVIARGAKKIARLGTHIDKKETINAGFDYINSLILKDLNIEDEELKKAVHQWLEALNNFDVCGDKLPKVNAPAAELFLKTVDRITKHDRELTIDVVKVAAADRLYSPSFALDNYYKKYYNIAIDSGYEEDAYAEQKRMERLYGGQLQ